MVFRQLVEQNKTSTISDILTILWSFVFSVTIHLLYLFYNIVRWFSSGFGLFTRHKLIIKPNILKAKESI